MSIRHVQITVTRLHVHLY